MELLTREAILNAFDLPTEEVHVPEWGGKVRVRGLTGAERDKFEAALMEVQGQNMRIRMQNARALLVVLGVVDEEGNHVFSEKDVKALGEKSAVALERVANAVMRLSGLQPGEIEELQENFE